MQKLITILCCVVSSAHTFQSPVFSNYKNQEKAKEELVFTDGVSFAQVEKELKERHPHIPNITLVEYFLNNNEMNKQPSAFYAPKGGRFIVDDGTLERKILPHMISGNAELKQLDSHGAKWLLSHEIGHAQYPYSSISSNIDTSALPVFLSTAYFWKKMLNPQKPYKNKITKFGSKYVAAQIISDIFVRLAYNLEERRADNYANHYSNKTEIESGINFFKTRKQLNQELWQSEKISKVLPLCIGQYFLDPLHPSIDSRIRKLKKAAQSKE